MVVLIEPKAGWPLVWSGCLSMAGSWLGPACLSWPTIGGAAARTHSHISPHHWGARSGPLLLLDPGWGLGGWDH